FDERNHAYGTSLAGPENCIERGTPKIPGRVVELRLPKREKDHRPLKDAVLKQPPRYSDPVLGLCELLGQVDQVVRRDRAASPSASGVKLERERRGRRLGSAHGGSPSQRTGGQ